MITTEPTTEYNPYEDDIAIAEPVPAKPSIQLSDEQKRAVDRVIEMARARRGGIIFLTGQAGTGKSVVVRAVRDALSCVVVAPTGLAAVNVQGATIHSTFKLKVGPLTRGAVGPLPREKRWVFDRADVIVIDEISMVRADLMDAISWVLQKTYDNRLPFGGKLLLVVGDMWQLEPVVADEGSRDLIKKKYASPFWFDAHCLGGRAPEEILLDVDEPGAIERIELTQVFRQTGNPEFLDALNFVRVGDPAGLEFFNRRAGIDPVAAPVALCYTNSKCDAVNSRRLLELNGEEFVYTADVQGDFKEQDCPVPGRLVLKIGAQVMCAKNIVTDGLGMINNGAIGEVVQCRPDRVLVELRDGREVWVGHETWDRTSYAYDLKEDRVTERIVGAMSQIPLKLAWAATVHKSQGQTLDAATIEAEMGSFAHGQLYVALSRVRSIDGLYLRRRLAPDDLVVHPRIRQFCLPIADAPALDLSAFDEPCPALELSAFD
jgi:hypothetical protein